MSHNLSCVGKRRSDMCSTSMESMIITRAIIRARGISSSFLRLVITTYAKPGKGAELAQAMAERCRAVQQEPGCQQFEVFQSALNPDKLVTLELWDDQAALDVHAQVNTTRPPSHRGRASPKSTQMKICDKTCTTPYFYICSVLGVHQEGRRKSTPVIAAGFSKPMIPRIVGAMSQRAPP